jgi:hypothetical protein
MAIRLSQIPLTMLAASEHAFHDLFVRLKL